MILLQHGKLLEDGNSSDICNIFFEHANARVAEYGAATANPHARIDSSGEVELLDVDVVDSMGEPTSAIASGDPLRIRIRFNLLADIPAAELIVGTHSTDFVYLTAGSTAACEPRPDLAAGVHEAEYSIPYFPLVPGVYCVRFSVYDGNKRAVYVGEALHRFRVLPRSSEIREPGSRILHIPATWRIDAKASTVEDWIQ